jgi:HK97 gp10 family phage protein
MAKVSGQEELLRNLSTYARVKVAEIYQAVATVQAVVVNEAKLNHPYTDRTTNLTKSIQAGVVEIQDDTVSAEIKAEAEYASFVEMGTSRSKPYPFLTPAIERHQSTFFRALQRAMRT